MIAISGPKGSGKDTVGQMIKEYVPQSKTIAYADPIKKVIQHLFDLDPESNEQYDLFKRSYVGYTLSGYISNNVEGRHLVREIGMLMRSYNENQFTDYVEEQIKRDPNKLWIVTDMRFNNELISLQKLGAILIKVSRPGYNYDGHVTETGFSDDVFDYNILNTGTTETLSLSVASVVDDIFLKWSCDETHSWT